MSAKRRSQKLPTGAQLQSALEGISGTPSAPPIPSIPPAPVAPIVTPSTAPVSAPATQEQPAQTKTRGIDSKGLLLCFTNYVEFLKNKVSRWGTSVNMQRDAEERQLEYAKKYVHLLEEQIQQEEGGKDSSNPPVRSEPPSVIASKESTPPPTTVKFSNVTEGQTLADGNCFFSGIFRSLLGKNKLKDVSDCLFKKPFEKDTDEPAFIQEFRNLLANDIAAGTLPFHTESGNKVDMHDYLTSTKKNNAASYPTIIAKYPTWFKDMFQKDLGDKKSFCDKLSKEIRTNGRWVGEIEVGQSFRLWRGRTLNAGGRI